MGRLGQELIQNNFCYKAQYKPLNPNSDGTEKKAKKWPDRLARTPKQDFDLEGFYVVTYEGSTSMQHFLLACIIIGILLVCMFPVWPMWAKSEFGIQVCYFCSCTSVSSSCAW